MSYDIKKIILEEGLSRVILWDDREDYVGRGGSFMVDRVDGPLCPFAEAQWFSSVRIYIESRPVAAGEIKPDLMPLLEEVLVG
jgi:hypothetical protein